MRLWAAAALNALSLQPEEEGREKSRVYSFPQSHGTGGLLIIILTCDVQRIGTHALVAADLAAGAWGQ